MTGKIKKVKPRGRYPEELKRKIAKEYLAGKASAGYLAEEHGLKNKSLVKEFVKWYRRKDELCIQNQDNMSNKKEAHTRTGGEKALERLCRKSPRQSKKEAVASSAAASSKTQSRLSGQLAGYVNGSEKEPQQIFKVMEF